MVEAVKPQVWVHVGSLMGWTQRAVGVLRVESEYARWLLENVLGRTQEAEPGQQLEQQGANLGVGFCIYDRATERFLCVSPARVAAQIEGLAQGTASRWTARADDPEACFQPGDRFVSLGLDWETLDHRRLWAHRQAGLHVTLMCYDLIPVRYPQWFAGVHTRERFSAYLSDLCWCANQVLCISRCTRDDLLAFAAEIGVPPPATRVVSLGTAPVSAENLTMGEGVDPVTQPGALSGLLGARAGEPPRPFVLCVGTIERRKNHEVLYRAMSRLRERSSRGQGAGRAGDAFVPYRMVIAGMRGWGVDDLLRDIELDPRTRDDIVLLHEVTDAQLTWLYRHCAFTVYPSLYEGWGLPVAESLAHGRFCLCSDAPSLIEVGADLCQYIDPWNLPAWEARLHSLMTDPSQVRDHETRIAREYEPTTWEQAAQKIHAAVTALTPQAALSATGGPSTPRRASHSIS